ncbi:hypothetical protein tb265_46280 [Gemmatimonadetes bacterium T265]|nr:hypothetical protein tb265_46280 [Gemmatimonadetes bacterium T265]
MCRVACGGEHAACVAGPARGLDVHDIEAAALRAQREQGAGARGGGGAVHAAAHVGGDEPGDDGAVARVGGRQQRAGEPAERGGGEGGVRWRVAPGRALGGRPTGGA